MTFKKKEKQSKTTESALRIRLCVIALTTSMRAPYVSSLISICFYEWHYIHLSSVEQ